MRGPCPSKNHKAGELVAISEPGRDGLTVSRRLAGWTGKAQDIEFLVTGFVGEERRKLTPGFAVRSYAHRVDGSSAG